MNTIVTFKPSKANIQPSRTSLHVMELARSGHHAAALTLDRQYIRAVADANIATVNSWLDNIACHA